MSKREHYMQRRFARRYGSKGALFVGRAWHAAGRYTENKVWGDVALSRIMDQIVRVQKLGPKVISDEHRDNALATMWELVEKIQGISDARDNSQGALHSNNVSPEFIDYMAQVYDPKDTGDIHEIRVEPAYIPEEIAPIRHTPEAWEALMEELPKDPVRVWQATLVLWQLWRLRNGANYLSWIS